MVAAVLLPDDDSSGGDGVNGGVWCSPPVERVSTTGTGADREWGKGEARCRCPWDSPRGAGWGGYTLVLAATGYDVADGAAGLGSWCWKG